MDITIKDGYVAGFNAWVSMNAQAEKGEGCYGDTYARLIM
jgi:hypothetical protein